MKYIVIYEIIILFNDALFSEILKYFALKYYA